MEDLNSMKKRADRYETDALAYFRQGDIFRWRSAQREANLLRQSIQRLMSDSIEFIQAYMQHWEITAFFYHKPTLKSFMRSEQLVMETDGHIYFTSKAVAIYDALPQGNTSAIELDS